MAGILALTACTGGAPCEQTAGREDVALALTLTDRDYTATTLAYVTVSGEVEPALLETGGDSIVRFVDGMLYVVKRAGGDAVSAFEPGASCPLWQSSLPPGTNVHDVVSASGSLWLPAFGDGAVLELDPADGALLSRVDLAHDDRPSTPDRAVVLGGEVWVADQHIALTERHAGELIRLQDGEVLERVEVGPNPRIRPDGDGLALLTGYYVLPEATRALDLVDGVLQRFAPGSGLGPVLLREADLQADLHSVVAEGGQLAVLAVEADAASGLICVGTDGEPRSGPAGAGWFVEAIAHDGEVWVASRASFDGEGLTSPELLRVDPTTCEERAPRIPTGLEPYDLVSLR